MDRLKLHDEKTEFLLVGTRQQLAKLCVEPLLSVIISLPLVMKPRTWAVGLTSSSVWSLINKICSVSYFYLHISITQLLDKCKSCILIGYATRGLLLIVLE